MICPKRLTELIEIHLSPLEDKNPCWQIGVSEIAGRGVFVTRDVKRGDVIFRDRPLIIGPAARQQDTLNACSSCFKLLNEEKFMCRQGCGLPVCNLCGKKKQHKAECDLFKSWEPNEPYVANSVIIRLLCVARANLLNKDEKELIYSLQANLDNNIRTEVRNGAKCFRSFPNDKKMIELMNRAVAVLRTDGFDDIANEPTTDNEEFPYRAVFPLFGVINHSCVPNTTFSFEDKTRNIIVKAGIDIAAGTEITTTYTKLFTGNIARYLFLKMKKTFTCRCERCTDPTVSNSNSKYLSYTAFNFSNSPKLCLQF